MGARHQPVLETVAGWQLLRLMARGCRLKSLLSLKSLSLNRGDLLLLLAGVVAFLMFTFLPGMVAPGNPSGTSGARPATAPYSPSAVAGLPGNTIPPDTFPWSGRDAA